MKKSMLIFLAGLFLLLSACASDSTKNRTFEATMRNYEQIIRWGDLEKANEYLKEPADFSLERHENLKKVQVNGYSVLSRTITDKGLDQVVEIKYTKDASVVLRTIIDVQKWVYDEDEERWYLISKIPKFK